MVIVQGNNLEIHHLYFDLVMKAEMLHKCQISYILFQSRSDADKQLAHRIKDANIRAWLLMNMGQLEDGSIGWTNNLDAIHESFRKGNL